MQSIRGASSTSIKKKEIPYFVKFKECSDVVFLRYDWLTIVGMQISIKGHRRPNLFVMTPNEMLPNKHPMLNNAAIHELSSDVILPEGRGVSSDSSRMRFGLGQPSLIPKLTVIKFAVGKSRIFFSI